MKRILLACFLLTATCTVFSIQYATAQTAPVPVTQASFMVKVNAMDAFITAGNTTAAQAKWDEIHEDMIQVLGVSKASLAGATTPTDQAHFTTLGVNQRTIYADIWSMHTDLTLNRANLKARLTDFSATIY